MSGFCLASIPVKGLIAPRYRGLPAADADAIYFGLFDPLFVAACPPPMRSRTG
jgi:hypothetical protein